MVHYVTARTFCYKKLQISYVTFLRKIKLNFVYILDSYKNFLNGKTDNKSKNNDIKFLNNRKAEELL